MARRNLTIQLDEATIRRAKIIAGEQRIAANAITEILNARSGVLSIQVLQNAAPPIHVAHVSAVNA